MYCGCFLNYPVPLQGTSSQDGLRHSPLPLQKWTPHLSPLCQRKTKTTPGSTRWTPSSSPSLWWAHSESCWVRFVRGCSSTARAPTAGSPRAPPRHWKTTTLSCTTGLSIKWRSTSRGAAPRHEEETETMSLPPAEVILFCLDKEPMK